ncbi:NUDIX domain-containing protein [Kitasatospora sp. NPDC059646]|uniref:NUDIX domain-containing protein n=1 Tax=Kitasatospora sp. NPDC059646 TaxID=3346893 RepID=UPI0036C47EEB
MDISTSALSAADAYAQAPDLDAEAATVAELLAELDPDRRPDFYPAVTVAEHREVYLRAAALADRRRLACQSPENLAAAEKAAELLMEFDRGCPNEPAGPFPPRSTEWAAYVRQEYRAWFTGPITESCGNCQGETCRQCIQAAETDAPAGVETSAAESDEDDDEIIKFTADVVCVRGGDTPAVLVVKRRWSPFEGEFALPGGHVRKGESSADAARRELGEETHVKVSPSDLVLAALFDAPDRDPRGRYVTAVYVAQVPEGTEAWPGDDAAAVMWVPIDDRPRLAFDHDAIVETVLCRRGGNPPVHIEHLATRTD